MNGRKPLTREIAVFNAAFDDCLDFRNELVSASGIPTLVWQQGIQTRRLQVRGQPAVQRRTMDLAQTSLFYDRAGIERRVFE